MKSVRMGGLWHRVNTFSLHRASDVPGRRGKVVSDRGGLVWSDRVWCSLQVRSVYKSGESSAVDLASHRHGNNTAITRQDTAHNRATRTTTGHIVVGPIVLLQGQ